MYYNKRYDTAFFEEFEKSTMEAVEEGVISRENANYLIEVAKEVKGACIHSSLGISIKANLRRALKELDPKFEANNHELVRENGCTLFRMAMSSNDREVLYDNIRKKEEFVKALKELKKQELEI